MSSEFPSGRSRPIHEEAEPLVNLISYSALLETKSLSEIRCLFESAGYKEGSFFSATIGWGDKVDEPNANTMCYVRSKKTDKEPAAILHLSLGSKGIFGWHVVVQDADQPKSNEFNKLREPENYTASNLGPGARLFIEENHLQDDFEKRISTYLGGAAKCIDLLNQRDMLGGRNQYVLQRKLYWLMRRLGDEKFTDGEGI